MCVCLRLCVRARVCPPPRLLIASGVMWHDMDPYDWLNKFYNCYMATVVVIVIGRGLDISTHCRHLWWPVSGIFSIISQLFLNYFSFPSYFSLISLKFPSYFSFISHFSLVSHLFLNCFLISHLFLNYYSVISHLCFC